MSMDEQKKGKRNKKTIAALVLAGIGLIAGILWFTRRNKKEDDDE